MKRPPANRLARYGLTPEDWASVLAYQGYACPICRRPFKDGRVPNTDHAHDTGIFRGLLCSRDNHDLLGHFRDDVVLFQNAAAYLLDPPAARLGLTARHRDAPPPLIETLADFGEDR